MNVHVQSVIKIETSGSFQILHKTENCILLCVRFHRLHWDDKNYFCQSSLKTIKTNTYLISYTEYSFFTRTINSTQVLLHLIGACIEPKLVQKISCNIFIIFNNQYYCFVWCSCVFNANLLVSQYSFPRQISRRTYLLELFHVSFYI